MRKLSIRPLKLILLTGTVILLSSVLTETIRAHGPHIWPRLHGLLALNDAITASLNANQMAAQHRFSHDDHTVFNNCLHFTVLTSPLKVHPVTSARVPDFGFNSLLQTPTKFEVTAGRSFFTIAFNCTESGPYIDPADPSTQFPNGQPDPNNGWYLQEIEGVEINDNDHDVAIVCKESDLREPADAFLTRICNPRAILKNGGKAMPTPAACINADNPSQPNMTQMNGCAVCTKPNSAPGLLCHAR